MYQLEITPEAKDELRSELAYSKKKWGQPHGQKYARELRSQIQALKANPHLHPVREDILPGIRIKIYKGNRIIYIIREERKLVAVLAVLSTHQNMDQSTIKRRVK